MLGADAGSQEMMLRIRTLGGLLYDESALAAAVSLISRPSLDGFHGTARPGGAPRAAAPLRRRAAQCAIWPVT